MLPDITNKRFAILGLQGSGKSNISKIFLKRERSHLIYDVHHEHSGFNRYLVRHKQVLNYKPTDPAIAELNGLVTSVMDSGQIRLFIIDEANRFCPNRKPLPSSILVLNDDNRHLKMAFGVIARRAVQLNTDLIELAHYIFIFQLPGKNDHDYLESVALGLGDAVRELKPFHFVVVTPSRNYKVHLPVEEIKSGEGL